MLLLTKNKVKIFYRIRVFLLFILLIPYDVFSQCIPDYTVQGDTVDSPGIITLTAGGCSTCTFQWYDAAGNTLDPGPVIHPNVSGKTLFTIYVVDNISGCSNYDPINDAVDTVWVVVNSSGPVIDTSVFGDGVWNVYCYKDKFFTNLAGYYVDSTDFINSSLLVNSAAQWAEGCQNCGYSQTDGELHAQFASPYILDSPDDHNKYKVPGYVGVEVPANNHSISYKRTNFAVGNYQIDVDNHDDQCWVLINGVNVFTHNGYGDNHVNIWRGNLGANSTVEFRWADGNANSIGKFRISQIPTIPNLKDGLWTVYCYNGTPTNNFFNNFSGYYIDSTDFVNDTIVVNSDKKWKSSCNDCDNLTLREAQLASPFVINEPRNHKDYHVAGFQGGEIQTDYHSIRYVRKGFSAGNYQFDINNHDNWCWVLINGKEVFNHNGWADEHKNIWRGKLDENSTVEFKWISYTSTSIGDFSIIKLPVPPALVAPLIIGDTSICYGQSNPAPLGGLFSLKDTYINSHNDLPYGNYSDMTITNPSKSGDVQTALISFDLSSVKVDSIKSAIINLWGKIDTLWADQYISIYSLDDNSWDENNLTYSQFKNGSYVLNKLDSIKMDKYNSLNDTNTYNLYHLNVTNYIKSKFKNGDKVVSFILKKNFAGYDDIQYQFASKENSNPYLRPNLLINSSDGCNNVSYQWEIDSTSNNGKNWKSILGATSYIYSPPTGIHHDALYRLKVTDKCGVVDSSNILSFKIKRNTGHFEIIEFDGNNGKMRYEGYRGSIYNWESCSDTSFNKPEDVTHSDILNFSKDSYTSYFRVVTQENGCKFISDNILIDLFIYNSISPNGDGVNDKWVIDGIENYPNNKVKIFNRWGAIVYQADNYNNNEKVWNGYSNINDRSILPDGTYFYNIEIFNHKIKTGYVELKR